MIQRLLRRLAIIMTTMFVVALIYALYGRDVLPLGWRTTTDPLAFAAIMIWVAGIAAWIYRRHFRYRDLSLERIDTMDGFEFERFCGYLLKRNGFRRISVTQESGDQGIDVIATKGKVRYGIQCKRYNGFVGNHAVQEVWTGHEYYDLDAAMVLTNSTFSDSAKELAGELGVELVDRDQFRKMLRHLPS